MDKQRIAGYHKLFCDNLHGSVMPFWERVCLDERHGGIRHNAARDGTIISPIKGGWFQGRGTWVFARMYNRFGQNEKHLRLAQSGYQFMVDHCFDYDGRMFFELLDDGTPLRKRRYFYSEMFAVMGMAEYAMAAGDDEALHNARELWKRVYTYYQYPALLPPKYIPGARQAKAHNIRMCLISTTQVMREADPTNTQQYDDVIRGIIDELMRDFVKPEKGAMFEEVGPKGELLLQYPSGRRINPGHSMESAWFIMMEAHRQGDTELMRRCLEITDWSMHLGWDEEFGGLYNYIDIEGLPNEKVEWDMKYWWTHSEAMNATLYAYMYTGCPSMQAHFEKLADYTFAHFPDEEYGEWYGYLHRDGTLNSDAKGGMFKGPFHIPRTLMYCTEALAQMQNT